MPEQYRLRLGDGTTLAVDRDGLRTWLLDAKAVAMAPGASHWRPLREIVEHARLAAALQPPPAVQPPVQSVAPPPEPPRPEPPAPESIPLALAVLEPIAGEPPQAAPEPAPAAPEPAPAAPAAPVASLCDLASAELERESGPLWQWSPPPRPEPVESGAIVAGEVVAFEDAAPLAARPIEVRDPEEDLPELGLIEEPPAAPPPAAGQPLLQLASGWAARIRPLDPALAQKWARRAAIAAGLGAAGILAVALTWALASRGAGLLSRASAPPAPVAATPAPIPRPATPEPPKEVLAAAEQLPHLSPETIQLVASTVDGGISYPAEVFRRAYEAANRGLSALTPEEAQELKTLRAAVLGTLRAGDRERLRAYDRLSRSSAYLLNEDAKVLKIYSRGVRALAPTRRERLQALLGKAIAADLAPAPRKTAGLVTPPAP